MQALQYFTFFFMVSTNYHCLLFPFWTQILSYVIWFQIFDIIFNLLSDKVRDVEIIKNPRKAIVIYLKSTFWYDVVLLIDLNLIYYLGRQIMLSEDSYKDYKVWRDIMNGILVPRCFMMNRIFNESKKLSTLYDNKMNANRYIYDLIALFG